MWVFDMIELSPEEPHYTAMLDSDMLALARYTAWRMLDHTEIGHEMMPEMDEAEYTRLVGWVQWVALELKIQAGGRGDELWAQTQ